jgi:hypothetical protein
MRYLSIFLISLSVPCFCWSEASTGAASTKGACSPAVSGNANQFKITCTGVSKEQGEKMLHILNEILAKQLDPNAVMSKLSEISSGIQDIQHRTGDRLLSQSQENAIAESLRSSPQTLSVILLGDREANAYGQQIISVLKSAGWTVNVSFIGVMGPPEYGVMVSGNETLLKTLKDAGIDALEGAIPMGGNLLIGLKPY